MTETSGLSSTQEFYDAIAVDYTEMFHGAHRAEPFGPAMLAAYAELAADAGLVADLGCGPGEVTAHLRSLGLDIFGVDVSPEMVTLARRNNPGVRFEHGSMTELGLADGALGGIVAWYSLIHTPPEDLPAVFAEFHRLLTPGGHVLLGFQVGTEPLRLTEPYGRPVSIDFRRMSPDAVADLLGQAGFELRARMVRAADEAEKSSKVPQACLIARRPR